jgi:hypothetical protein
VLEALEVEGLVTFDTSQAATVSNIPANVFRALAGLVVLEVGRKFGQVLSDDEWERRELRCLRKIRRVVHADPDETPVAGKYF